METQTMPFARRYSIWRRERSEQPPAVLEERPDPDRNKVNIGLGRCMRIWTEACGAHNPPPWMKMTVKEVRDGNGMMTRCQL
jgi:hypothetical protein